MRGLFGEAVVFEDVDLGAGDAAAIDLGDMQRGVEMERGGGGVEDFGGDTGVEKRGEEHVAGDSGIAVEIGDAHGDLY
jgi:hypothetical protein